MLNKNNILCIQTFVYKYEKSIALKSVWVYINNNSIYYGSKWNKYNVIVFT
jgi:hypothetical protein